MSQPIIIGSNTPTASAPNQRAIGDILAMQLAAITYCSLTHNVASTLNKSMPGWTLVWVPQKIVGGNYAFIAYNGVQYVVAIRGSILQFSWAAFDNWIYQDFNILLQTKWQYPYNLSTNPMISQGSADGLSDLMQLTDTNGDTILSFLMKNAIPQGKFLCVTGHSLGGNLATVYATYLLNQIQLSGNQVPSIFSVLTFAAPTSWNKGFADLFDSAFTNTWRYFSVLDIVPFSACTISGLGALYPPPTPSAGQIFVTFNHKNYSLADAFTEIQKIVTDAEDFYTSRYTLVNQNRGSIPLNLAKHEYPVTNTDPLIEQWFSQAGAQHDHNHYLDWLGGAEINCTN